MSSTRCPDQESLRQLLQGELPGPTAEALEEHLLNCDACTSTAETMMASDESTSANRATKRDENNTGTSAESIERRKQIEQSERTVGIDETLVAPGLLQDENAQSSSNSSVLDEIGFLAPAEQDDEIGRLGGYRVLEVLGVGGMGIVFRAEDPQLKRQIALKAMKPTVATSRSAKDRFIREAQATAAIEHDNIVQIYQVGEDRGVPFIAMRYLRGESLQTRLYRQGRLDQAAAGKIGRQIAEGLEAAHRRDLIHRDIKPDNIWLEEGRDRVKIVDFGLVRSADDDAGLTKSGVVVGTPKYMAPEQAQGQVVDHRSDLFSLGSLLYRLVTGIAPFEGSNITATLIAVAQADPTSIDAVQPDIHPGLGKLIMQLLSKDQDARPQSAAEVAASLNAIENELPCDLNLVDGRDSTDAGDVPTLSYEQAPLRKPAIGEDETRSFGAGLATQRKDSSRGGRIKFVAACLGGLALVVAAIVFFVRVGKYDVQITVDDPAIALKVDGDDVLVDGAGTIVRLSAGTHMLHIEKDGLEAELEEFTVKKDGANVVHVAIVNSAFELNPRNRDSREVAAVEKQDPPPSNETESRTAYHIRLSRSDRIEVPLDNVPSSRSATLEAWLRPTMAPPEGSHDQYVFQLQGNHQLKLETTDHFDIVGPRWEYKVRMQPEDSEIHPKALTELHQWQHVACVRDGDLVRLFVNGNLAIDGERAGTYEDDGDELVIGRVSDKFRGFVGDIREIRISTIARYETDFTPKRSFTPDEHTLALFRANEASGSVLHDSSDNGRDGTIFGAKWVITEESLEPELASNTPPIAAAPFDAATARSLQQAWASYLGQSVETELELPDDEKLILVLVPPGEFKMGAPESDDEASANEKPQHDVVLTNPFQISATEVTIGQFRQFVETSGYVTQAESDGKGAFAVKSKERRPSQTWVQSNKDVDDMERLPVTCVSWQDGVQFCEWLGERYGGTFRLPTEAEWEFACRAGSTTRYSFADELDTSMANLGDSWLKPVASYAPNSFGLFDMHGSVHEICTDSGRKYTSEKVEDPRGPDGDTVAVRGGSSITAVKKLRSAHRFLDDRRNFPETNFATQIKGFRVVRLVDALDRP